MSRELLKHAYEMMHCPPCTSNSGGDRDLLCEKIKEYLAKPLPEPVAWMTEDGRITTGSNAPEQFGKHWCIPLYAEPPARKPLTDDEMQEVLDEWLSDPVISLPIDLIRLTEQKHGIK